MKRLSYAVITLVLLVVLSISTAASRPQGDWECASECGMIAEAYEAGCNDGGGDMFWCNHQAWMVIYPPCMRGCGYPYLDIVSSDGFEITVTTVSVDRAKDYLHKLKKNNPNLTREEAVTLLKAKVRKWAKQEVSELLKK